MRLFARDGQAYKEIKSRPLRDENELQELLADHPNLVSWDLDERHLAVRELSTRAGPIDHVIVDAQGHIVIVETKLEKNITRRGVVAQAIDYASQLHRFGSQEFIDAIREKKGFDFTQDWFTTKQEREAFQRSVEANLRQGRFVLMIVMDHAEDLLKDVVRFFNRSTQLNCILLELRVVEAGGQEFVHVESYGHESVEEKAFDATDEPGSERARYDRQAFLDSMTAAGFGKEAEVFVQAIEWARENGFDAEMTARGYRLGGPYSLQWYTGAKSIEVYARANLFDARRSYLGSATEPWRSRMTLRTLKEGRAFGKVADIDPKGATRAEFEQLFSFYLKGP